MTEGKVVSYDPESEEGDIQPDGQDEEIPFYSDGFKDSVTKDRLSEGDRVRFDIVGGLAGLKCTDIELVES